jgi:hypothetical protein
VRGIYKISVGDKYYYGSCLDFIIRERSHKYHLLRGSHFNRRLQALWDKGYDFEFKFIEEVYNIHELLTVEQKYLDKYFNIVNCLNLCENAERPPGGPKTENSIKKQLITKQLKNNFGGANENSWKAAALANTGAKRSSSAKEKMSKRAKENYTNSSTMLEKKQQLGRKNRWYKYCKSFMLVKNDISYGPFKKQQDARKLLSNVSISKLYLGKIQCVKGYTLEFC